MKIFLSHATAQKPLVELLYYALDDDGHRVFFDMASLPSGESFDARIRAAIEQSDVFVFFLSPASVRSGSYALTELFIALDPQARRRPKLVVIEVSAVEELPAALQQVEIFRPAGNLVAESARHIEKLARRSRAQLLRRGGVAIASALVLGAAAWEAAAYVGDPVRALARPAARTEAVDAWRRVARERQYKGLAVVEQWLADPRRPSAPVLRWRDLATFLNDHQSESGDLLLAAWAPQRPQREPPALLVSVGFHNADAPSYMRANTSINTTLRAGDIESLRDPAELLHKHALVEWVVSFGPYIGAAPRSLHPFICKAFPQRPPDDQPGVTLKPVQFLDVAAPDCPTVKWPLFPAVNGPFIPPPAGEDPRDSLRRSLYLPLGAGESAEAKDGLLFQFTFLVPDAGPVLLAVVWASR